nr:fumarylacetoacetate hydrolase [Pseudorhodoferax sp.]
MPFTLAALAVAGLLAAGAARSACLSDADVTALAEAIAAKTPAATPEGLDDADASCTRAKLNRVLAQRLGAVAGYKAGLTNPAVQKRFGTDKPVWGVLYRSMLLDSGATVDPAFGARALYEADMLVRVKSEAINRAKTPAEVLAAVDQIIPFIELPDLAVQAPPKLNGPGVAAINVGARLGVQGAPIAVLADAAAQSALLNALRDMTVRLTDQDGAELARGKGADILEHPLNAVVWLAGALAAEGLALQPGQVISLGSFSPLLPPKPGLGVTAHYDGLPGAQPVVVRFRP